MSSPTRQPARMFFRFSPRTALLLFIAALATSVALLVSGFGESWLAFTLPLVVYGGALVVAQRGGTALSGTLKDSPYFLGFVLTLVALARVFWLFGNGSLEGDTARLFLVRQVGGALATTIIGLLFRQTLLLLDPGESTRDAVFQSVMDGIRRNAGDFATAQARLVGLIAEFSHAREVTLNAEQSAHERHLRALDELSGRLEQTEQQWATRFGGFDSAINGATDQLLQATAVLSKGLADSRVEIEQGVAAVRAGWQARAADDQAGLAAAATSLRTSATSVAESMRTSSESIAASTAAWEQISRLIPGEAARVTVEAERIREDAQLLGRAFGELRTEASTLRQSLSAAAGGLAAVSRQIGDESGVAVRAMHDSLRQPHEAVRAGLADLTTQLANLSAEVRSIDSVVSEVVSLLEGRMKALEQVG